MKRLHIFQHLKTNQTGHVTLWAQKRNLETTISTFFDTDYIIPPADEVDGLVVLGGPMSVNDEENHPHLIQEKAFIREMYNSGKKIFGICLGAQMIANAFKSKVSKSEVKEIGWHEISLTPEGIESPILKDFPKNFSSFQFHEDTFELPEGAELLASTPECPNQAYSIKDKVFAVQFHPEMQEDTVINLANNWLPKMGKGKKIQEAEEMLSQCSLIPENHKRLEDMLDRFFLKNQ
ncbi:MAG: type 1 glutamine amidotransferase [Bacteroidales bacterium]